MKKLFPIFLLAIFAFVACDDDDSDRISVNDDLKAFIEQKYPAASILYAEYDDNGLVEVNIRHDDLRKEVHFTGDNKWVFTSWNVLVRNVPDVIKVAVESEYPGFIIGDVDFIERENENYYEIEIEKGGVDMLLFVSPSGEIIR